MSDYFEFYTKWHQTGLNIQLRVIKDHIQHYEDLNNFFGFHYWLQDNVATSLNNVDDPAKFAPEAFIHTAFQQNFLTASGVLSELEKNNIHSARMMLRVILESIPKMYYTSFFPNEIAQIMCADYTSGYRRLEREKKVKHFVKSIWKGHARTNINKMLNDIKDKYYFPWYLKKIYLEDTSKPMIELHSHLNTSAHPSFTRSLPEYNKENTDNEIRHLELLLYYNIAAEMEGQKRIIASDIFTRNESMQFLNKMAKRISKNGQFVYLFPNNPDIIPKFNCRPTGSPWE